MLAVVIGECCKALSVLQRVFMVATSIDSAALQSVCSLPKPNGARVFCRGSDVKKQWFYKADENRCRPFISCFAPLDSQVGGGINSFNSLAECSAECIGEYNAAGR